MVEYNIILKNKTLSSGIWNSLSVANLCKILSEITFHRLKYPQFTQKSLNLNLWTLNKLYEKLKSNYLFIKMCDVRT